MEKKLLVLITILVGASSLDAARTVTIPRGGTKDTTPAQKLKPSKYDMAMDDADQIRQAAIDKLNAIVGRMETSGLPIATDDHTALIMAIRELREPAHKNGPAPLLHSKTANDLYKLVRDTFYKIKGTPGLMPGQGFGMAISFANEASGIIGGYYVSTVHGTSGIAAKGNKAPANADKKTYK